MHAKIFNSEVLAFPYTDRDLRRDNRNVSFPADLDDETRAEYQMVPVIPAEIPEGKISLGSTAQWIEGAWRQVHDLADMPVPAVVSMRQARLALLGAGLLGAVESGIDGLPEPDRSAARIEWEYATELRRDHPLIASLAQQLGLSEQQVDGLFIAASQIT